MNLRVLVAALVGAILSFGLGFVIYGIALASFMKAHTIAYPGLLKDPPDMVPLILSNFAFAWLYAYIFDHWASIKTFAGGAIGGIAIAIPLALAIDLQYMAFMNIYGSLLVVLVDLVAISVMYAITGGVIGLILGWMSPKS